MIYWPQKDSIIKKEKHFCQGVEKKYRISQLLPFLWQDASEFKLVLTDDVCSASWQSEISTGPQPFC